MIYKFVRGLEINLHLPEEEQKLNSSPIIKGSARGGNRGPKYSSLRHVDLLLLLKTGEDSDFAELYNRYCKKLPAIAYNYTKDKSRAEEIVQEVFISFLFAGFAFDSTLSPSSLNIGKL